MIHSMPKLFFIWVLCCAIMTPVIFADELLKKPLSLEKDSEFLPVEQAFILTVVEIDNEVKLHWQIAPGYYLYRQQLSMELSGAHGDPVIPAGVVKHDEYFGDVEVYFKELTVTVPIEDVVEQRHVSVTYQGCAEAGLCYPKQNHEVLL